MASAEFSLSRGSTWVLALVLALSTWISWEALRLVRADWSSAAARRQVLEWISGAQAPSSAAEWEEARIALQASLDITPDDPTRQERLGDLYAVAGQRDWSDVSLRRRDYLRAADFYQRAIDLRPSEPGTWAMLAATLQAAGEPPARVHAAWATSQRLGPFEAHVQPILMQVVLADWPNASDAMRDWASQLYENGTEAARRDINLLAKRYGIEFAPDPPATAPKQ